jgi:membrane protein implicated in regulation of membrane protease activity
VRNPFRSEADAFRLVLLSVGYFALIVVAAAINTWLGVAVFIVLTLIAIGVIVRARREPPQQATIRPSAPGERRILVVANETVGGEPLRDLIRRRSEGVEERVRVVCPALMSPMRYFASDEDRPRAAANERLERSLARLRELGITAEGEVGDADPLQAIEDALRTFGADEVIISTHPEGRSVWLEKGVVRAARERFDVPITHVVVDLEAERDEVPS